MISPTVFNLITNLAICAVVGFAIFNTGSLWPLLGLLFISAFRR
jgi:hypothetical protein